VRAEIIVIASRDRSGHLVQDEDHASRSANDYDPTCGQELGEHGEEHECWSENAHGTAAVIGILSVLIWILRELFAAEQQTPRSREKQTAPYNWRTRSDDEHR
jgi:hypothetical protein